MPCKAVMLSPKSKSSQFTYEYNKSSKSRSDNSRTEKDIKSHFSDLPLKINLIYLLWKPKLPKSTFNSRAYFTKPSIERKKALQRHSCHKDISNV